MYIASRGWGKSFLLALYSILKCTFTPGTKIVIVGAAFRRVRLYLNIWKQCGETVRSSEVYFQE